MLAEKSDALCTTANWSSLHFKIAGLVIILISGSN
jgi:hypothetical protein